ncbi:uncharacterized protein LOC124641357 [Helicoverpa zea]|uniref:uncharacterized protein LOC124641357 n=1 Tax=Helicoverpa zea TaxID=7113 RepID=UPI001F59B536|nr:uncharacterized protein LOC124641357 [Helicoverpa zea]
MANKKNKIKKKRVSEVKKIRKCIAALRPRTEKGTLMSKTSTDGHSKEGQDAKTRDDEDNSMIVETENHEDKLQKTTGKDKDDSIIVETENQEEEDDYYNVEPEIQEDQFQTVTGRRVIDINYLFSQLQEKARHNNLFDCKQENFQLISEKRIGLISVFKFECNICKQLCFINSEKTESKVNVNIAATTGMVATGIGYSQFEELFSAMNIPVFSTNYYNQLQDKVYECCEKTAAASMQDAAEEEKKLAIAEGRTKNGIPVIDVYVDASWCARSYGSNYKAASGTAAIIGRRTGKIIFLAVKNKYCLVCARAENKNVAPNEHKCFKNFHGSSCSMEGQIIAEGFKLSISMYGIIYKRMIADGDASTYAKVLKENPYKDQNITVEKIECRNHILRNLCKKLRSLVSETKYLLAHRKTLTDVKIMSMRKAIVRSVIHHNKNLKDDAVTILHSDIINSVAHAYGDHRMCQDYNCDKEKLYSDGLKTIRNSTFLFRINSIISNVAVKSRSLIENVNTNLVECFNNVIAKFIGGKRINFALKRGYQARCNAAVVKFNEKSAISFIKNTLRNTNRPEEGLAEVVERKREEAQKRKNNTERPAKRKIRKLADTKPKQNDYGPASLDPDMSLSELEVAKKEFLKNLEILTADKDAIERTTILQRDSSEWLEIRKNLITASNFGPICKRQVSKDTAPLVKNILYKTNLGRVASIAYGIENEQQALHKIQQQENVSIEPCGLFIDTEFPFIGATPDGLIGKDILVEVKCPFSALKIGLKKAIEENKVQILKFNKKTRTTSINTNSNWFYQIQGQLHVARRRQCLLGIWAGEKEPVHIEMIKRDDLFWKSKMESKIIRFYHKCLLPEIVNPRHTRGMSIRSLTLEDNISSENKENEESQDNPDSQLGGECHEDCGFDPLRGDSRLALRNVSVDEIEPGPSTRPLNFCEF